MRKKFLKAFLVTLTACAMFLPANFSSAEIMNYDGIGEYIMSDFETPDVAKQRAKLYAERNAQEQAGVYIKSYSRMENFKLVEDEVIAITSGCGDAYQLIGDCYGMLGNCAEAEKYWELAKDPPAFG